MSSCSKLNPDNISALDLQYKYELIPDCPAAVAAGYTAQDRANAQVYYRPIVDKENFYYVAWTGSALFLPHKSGIFVCRKRKNGKFVYAVNCRDYTLDIAPNFIGDTAIIPRMEPAICGNTIYLCNGTMTNIGPQLFAVNKLNGQLKWAAAYYPPEAAGNYITIKADYSQYTGSNMRLSDLCPVVKRIKKRKYIFVGSASAQNSINVGVVNNQFPIYTDQGFLFMIEDLGTTSQLIWKTPTCAPLLKSGDLLLKNGPAQYDPFMPDQTNVIFTSITSTTNYFDQPYYLADPPLPGLPNTVPISAEVTFNSTTVINVALVQTIWQNIANIYQDSDRTTSRTLAQLIALWQAEQAGLQPGQTVNHSIWSYIDSTIVAIAIGQPAPANNNILYFKQLFSGQTVGPEDAQGLNYYGNSLWAARPKVDRKNNLIYFGTGQAHSIPLSESLFYNQPQYNFTTLRTPVVDIIYRYLDGTASLELVNDSKNAFVQTIKSLAIDNYLKSPRGRLSYSDAIMGAYILPFIDKNGHQVKGGDIAFGVRSVPCDFYSFIANDGLQLYPLNVIDADISAGVNKYCNKLTSCTKGGIAMILDIEQLNDNIIFDHLNLSEKGVIFEKLLYQAPSSLIGGCNYQQGDKCNLVISAQSNIGWLGGTFSSAGQPEFGISPEGQVYKTNDSFLQAIDSEKESIVWSTSLGNRAQSQVIIKNHIAFTADSNGSLYAVSAKSGQILWKYDGTQVGMNGGINAPFVAKNGQIFWVNNYNVFGIGSPGPNGAVFKINPKILLDKEDDLNCLLYKKKFVSWDLVPKLSDPNPSVNPINNMIINHRWSRNKVIAHHQVINPPSTFEVKFKLKSKTCCKGIFKGPIQNQIEYLNLEMINKEIYQFRFVHHLLGGSVRYTVWLNIIC